MFCALSVISLSWKTLVFGRFTSQERTNVHRTAFFLHTPDFSLSKVTALKVVWGKDTSRRSKEPGSDLPSCFSAWAPFCKCGWRHHISRSGCGPDCLGVPNSAQWTYNWNFFSLHNLSILYFKALVCINYNYSVWFYIKIDLTWLNSGEPRKVNATL